MLAVLGEGVAHPNKLMPYQSRNITRQGYRNDQTRGVTKFLKFPKNQTNPTQTQPDQIKPDDQTKSDPRAHQQGVHQRERGDKDYEQVSNSTLLLSQKARDNNNNHGKKSEKLHPPKKSKKILKTPQPC